MTIYYFTGTGNSLKTAIDLQKLIAGSTIKPIARINPENYVVESGEMLLVFPLYYYGIPVIINEFLTKVDLSHVQRISCVITAMYPDGIGLEQIRSLLKKRGRELSYGAYLKMPTNFVSFFEPLPDKKRDSLLEKASLEIQKIAGDLKSARQFIQKETFFYALVTLAQKNYREWRQRVHTTDKGFIIKENCNGCGICKKVCPVGNIELANNSPVFHNRCEQCYGCLNLCPQMSIGYKKMKKGRYKHPEITLTQLIEG